MSGASFPAFRFDGRTALAQEVEVTIEGDAWSVTARGDIQLERLRIDPARVSERFDNAPRMVDLGRGATLSIDDADGRFDRVLRSAGVEASPAQRMQRAWPAVLVALAGIIGIMTFAYTHGVPAAARWLAFALPVSLEQRIGDVVLEQLDHNVFEASALSEERRGAITRRFAAAAKVAAPDVNYLLRFRQTDGDDGVNALALPGGTIVLLDGLVNLGSDEALMGVLGHELGHVAGKHSMRGLLQSLGMGAMAAVIWGDFSGVIANVPVALGVLRYSRDFEREADGFAIAFLQANAISTLPLLDFFTTMEQREEKASEGGKGKRRQREAPAFLLTHPPTPERQQRLRDAAGP